MLVSPLPAWQAIVAANRGFVWGLFCVLIPVMILGIAVENAGIKKLGAARGEFRKIMPVPDNVIARHMAVQAAGGLALAFIAAGLISKVGSGLELRCGFGRIFALVACALVPIYLLKMPDGIPQLPTWVCFAVGALICASVLYHGVGIALEPEQTKGFGLYILSVMIIVALAAVTHLLEVATLNETLFENLDVPVFF